MDALSAFWRWEGHDRMPAVLLSVVAWMDEQSRREADQQALAELAARGLLVSGSVPLDMRTTIQALTRPELEVYGWIGIPQQVLGVVAAARDREGVLVVRSGGTAWLSSVRPDAVAEAVVAQLPAMRPAQGRSVNVPAAELAPSGSGGGDEGFAGFGRQTESHDVRSLKTLLAKPTLGLGQLWVAARGADGRRRQSELPLIVRDTAEGRWLTQTTLASGQPWVIAAPATPQLVIAKLYETLRSLG